VSHGCCRLLLNVQHAGVQHTNLLLASLLSSTGYTREFLRTSPELVAIGSGGINAGNDEEADKEEDDDKSVFADKINQNQDPPSTKKAATRACVCQL
jgi:hypothetical protein